LQGVGTSLPVPAAYHDEFLIPLLPYELLPALAECVLTMLQPTAVYQGNPEDPHNGWPTLEVGFLSGSTPQKVPARQRKNIIKMKTQ
jgi:hypothetical protein